jgi:hypothetical protein
MLFLMVSPQVRSHHAQLSLDPDRTGNDWSINVGCVRGLDVFPADFAPHVLDHIAILEYNVEVIY